MKSIHKFLLYIFLFITASLQAQGDFSFSAGKFTPGSEYLHAEIIAKVGKNHMLYRNQTAFSAENGRLEIEWPETKEKNDPFTNEKVEVFGEGQHVFKLRFYPENSGLKSFSVTTRYQGCSDETCFFPTSETFEFSEQTPQKSAPAFGMQLSSPFSIKISTATAAPNKAKSPQTSSSTTSQKENIKEKKNSGASDLVDFSETMQEHGTVWVLFLAFLGGLLVSLTPCVYPMIPVTLSIIGSRDENQSFLKGLGLSATYVAGLSLTYALLGLAAATFGSHIRAVLQGTFFQAAISLVFFLLALSMFDVFMIQAPASLRNKFGSMKKTGLFGIFFLGMVSGLMASPCVAAPLAGILAFIATTGSQILGFLMLLIFAWGMSVPLLLIGAFSGSLNSLPKAGDWMNRIKEFYGFLLLGAAIYFAKPLVSIFWAELATSALLAAFAAFLGLFKPLTENTSLGSRVSKAFAVVVISVACAYAISATTRLGCLTMPQMINSGSSISASNKLYWHTDLDKAKETARKENRPVFIDFRADWCTICRELETNVFPTPEITMLLEKMVPVKIDATDPDEQTTKILDDFQIPGLPTLILLDKNGEEIKELRMIGNITSKQLEKNLRQALD